MKTALDSYTSLLEDYPKERNTPHVMEVLRKDEVDAVAICTESGNHAEIAIRALKAVKHVLVEKPMAFSIADADAMIEAADRTA